MKNSHLLLGILLILIGGISLCNFFWKDEIHKKTSFVETQKYIEDSQLDTSSTNKKQMAPLSTHLITKKENIHNSNTTNNVTDQLETQAIQEREYKRLLAIEHRKSKIAEKKRYKIARIEWRKALNKARKEAKLSGDYSKFEAIKKQEPGKE